MLESVDPKDIISYDPEVDIAMICLEIGRAVGEKYPWGLIERDRETGRLMGIELWQASTVLPAEVIEALSKRDMSHGTAV